MNKKEVLQRIKSKRRMWESYNNEYSRGLNEAFIYAEGLIDQLDEPTSQLSEKDSKESAYDEVMDKAIKSARVKITKRVKGMLESQRPAIPDYVAEWIEDYKEQGYSAINAVFNIVRGAEDLYMEEYLRENLRTFIDAWDNGYTIEKEKKYYVMDNRRLLLTKVDEKVVSVTSYVVGSKESIVVDDELTEQEIKDYDERYMVFAEEVTE